MRKGVVVPIIAGLEVFMLLLTPFAPILPSYFVPTVEASSGVPTILSYQGRLADSAGDLLGGAGTTYYFKFSIWNNATVGSGTKLWPTTTPSTSATATVRQGVFNVNIGDTANGYPDALDYNFSANKDVYLQVEISSDGLSFDTLTPRERIASAVFAQVSGSVSGVSNFSSFGTTTPLINSMVTIEATSSAIVPLSIRAALGQVANIFDIQNNAGDSLLTVNSSGDLKLTALSSCTSLTTDISGKLLCGESGEINWGFFNGSGIRVSTSTNQVLIGAEATSTQNKLEVVGNSYFEGNLGIGTTTPGTALSVTGTGVFTGAVTAPSFYATSTLAASVFSQLVANGSTTLQNFTALNSTTTAATSTIFFAATASSTNLFATSYNFATGSIGVLTVNGGATSTFSGIISVGSNCVLGSTRLRRRRRLKSGIYIEEDIELLEIQTGDEIASMDNFTGEIKWQKVYSIMEMGESPIWYLETESGKKIGTTAEHPYFVKMNDRTFWRKIIDIQVGDLIAVADNGDKAISWEKIKWIGVQGHEAVYDLEIEGTHNFLANNIIAHNTATSTFEGGINAAALNITGTATSTFNNGINLVTGCFSVGNVCVGGGGSGTAAGTNGQLQFNDGGTAFGALSTTFYDSAYGALGIGTTTPKWLLQLATSTSPQLTLTDSSSPADKKHWSLRSQGGSFFLATSSDTTFASTTPSEFTPLSISSTGNFSVATNTQIQMGGLGILTRTSTGAILGGDLTGNVRGTGSLDIQTGRTAVTQVASGPRSIAIGMYNTVSNTGGLTGAFGVSNTVSGSSGRNMAFGYGNTASGRYSYAFGSQNSASGRNASAFGLVNTASGQTSTASGYYSTASGNGSSALGVRNTASGVYATGRTSAVGYQNNAGSGSGRYGNAFGAFNITSASSTSAFGAFNVASGTSSSAFGHLNHATASSSSAFGANNTASAYGASVFGSFITNNIASSTQIGPSDESKVTISNSGDVGFGTTTPAWLLQLASSTSAQLTLSDPSALTNSHWSFRNAGGNFYLATSSPTTFATSSIPALAINANGFLGVGTSSPSQTLSVNGTVGFNGLSTVVGANQSLCMNPTTFEITTQPGDSCAVSSARFKNTIVPLSDTGLDMLRTLRPVSFKYNGNTSDATYWGFIAEEAASISPELAYFNKDGTVQTINSTAILSVATKALKELDLNIGTIASTTASSTPASRSFAESFFSNVSSRLSQWFADSTNNIGKLFAHEVHTDTLCVKKSDGTEVCITGDQLLNLVGSQVKPDEETNTSQADTIAPVIAVNGNDPATITVGDTYSDLGVIVTDNVDKNLAIHTLVDEVEKTEVQIDTSVPGKHTVVYSVTDNAGNSAQMTRTVIVSASFVLAPVLVPVVTVDSIVTGSSTVTTMATTTTP